MKALVGSWETRPTSTVAELTALRSRVAELHRELAEARAENAALRRILAVEQSRELSIEPAVEASEAVLSSR